jgi:hypothetical protein
MTAWAPAKSEPNPLQTAINDIARSVLLPGVAPPPTATRTPEGWHSLTLADGRQAVIALEAKLRPDRHWGPRAVLSYDLVGKATLDREGFSFTGRAVVDQATRAFLEVDCRLKATGRIG